MNGETTGGIESSATSVTFKMLRLLVRDQDLKIVEVAFAIIAPRPLELLVEVWPLLAFLRHFGQAYFQQRESKLRATDDMSALWRRSGWSRVLRNPARCGG